MCWQAWSQMLAGPTYQPEYVRKLQVSFQDSSPSAVLGSAVPEYLASLYEVIQNDCNPGHKPRVRSRQNRRILTPLPVLPPPPIEAGRTVLQQPRTSIRGGVPKKRVHSFPHTLATELDIGSRNRTQYGMQIAEQRLRELHDKMLRLPRWDERDRAVLAYAKRKPGLIATAALGLCPATEAGDRTTPLGPDLLGKRSSRLIQAMTQPVERKLKAPRPVDVTHASAGQAKVSRFGPRHGADLIICPMCSSEGSRHWFTGHRAVCCTLSGSEVRRVQRRDEDVLQLRADQNNAAVILQSMSRKMLAKALARLKRAVYTRSAVTLQRWWRRFLKTESWKKRVRSVVRAKRNHEAKVRDFASERLNDRASRRRHGAVLIQRELRRYLKVKNDAITQIQKFARGKAGRRRGYQTYWNRWVSCRVHRWVVQWKMRRKHEAATTIMLWWQGWLVRKPTWAAQIIQRFWRKHHHVNWSTVKTSQALSVVACALKLQTCWRGFLGRKALRMKRTEAIRRQAAMVLQRTMRGRLNRNFLKQMFAQKKWDQAHKHIRSLLDQEIENTCPPTLKPRFCRRRTHWGQQVLYLNRGQRLRITRSFAAAGDEIRATYLRFMLYRKETLSLLKPEEVGGLPIQVLLSMVEEAGMPHTLEEMTQIVKVALYTRTNYGLKETERKERQALFVEPAFPQRSWTSVQWPAWREVPPQVTVKPKEEGLFHLVQSLGDLGDVVASAKAAAAAEDESQADTCGDGDQTITLDWGCFVDTLFALSRRWVEATRTWFTGGPKSTDPAGTFASFVETNFGKKSPLAEANSKTKPGNPKESHPEAVLSLQDFQKPLGQLMQFYREDGQFTPRSFVTMMAEGGLAPTQPLVIKLCTASASGEAHVARFLQGETDAPLGFGLSLEEAMGVLASIATDLNKKQKTKSSMKKTAADLVKRLFTKSPHNVNLEGLVTVKKTSV